MGAKKVWVSEELRKVVADGCMLRGKINNTLFSADIMIRKKRRDKGENKLVGLDLTRCLSSVNQVRTEKQCPDGGYRGFL